MAKEIDTTERDADIRTMRALMHKHGWVIFKSTDYGCVFSDSPDKAGTVLLNRESAE